MQFHVLSFTQTLPTAKCSYILLSTFFRVYRVVYWNADDVGVHVKKMRITLRDMRLSHLSSLVLKDYLSRLWRCQFYRHFSFNTIIPLIKFWTCTINSSWNSFSFFFFFDLQLESGENQDQAADDPIKQSLLTFVAQKIFMCAKVKISPLLLLVFSEHWSGNCLNPFSCTSVPLWFLPLSSDSFHHRLILINKGWNCHHNLAVSEGRCGCSSPLWWACWRPAASCLTCCFCHRFPTSHHREKKHQALRRSVSQRNNALLSRNHEKSRTTKSHSTSPLMQNFIFFF